MGESCRVISTILYTICILIAFVFVVIRVTHKQIEKDTAAENVEALLLRNGVGAAETTGSPQAGMSTKATTKLRWISTSSPTGEPPPAIVASSTAAPTTNGPPASSSLSVVGSDDGGISTDTHDKALQLMREFRNAVHKRYKVPAHVDWEKGVRQLEEVTEFSNEEAVVNRLMKKIKDRSKFVWTFGGTSVTAGHDVKLDEAYPHVFETIMRPIFAAVGVDVVVRNVAMGANPIFPYSWCLQTHMGEDSDVLGWEMEMMTGNFRTPTTNYNEEQWIRRSFAMENKPSVIFLGSGFKRMARIHGRKSKMMVLDEMMEFYRDSTAAPAELQLRATYELDWFNIDYDNPTWFLEGKCCGHRHWHPGAVGHQWMADTLALAYLGLFEKALRNLQKGMPVNDAFMHKPVPEFFESNMHPTLQEGSHGFDPFPSSFVPVINCFTTFAPKVLDDRDLVFHVSSAGKTLEDKRPKVVGRPADVAADWPASENKWFTTVSFPDIAPVRQSEANYLDYKWALFGNANSPPLEIEFESGQKPGPLAICSPPMLRPEGISGVSLITNATALLTLDGEVQHTLDPIPGFKHCTIIKSELAMGKHVLSVRVTQSTIIGVSHLIFFAAT